MTKKPKAILFVEFHRRKDTITAAKEAGFKAILLTSKPANLHQEIFDEVIQLDLSERPSLDSLVKDLKSRYLVKGILSNYEHFVVQRSYLASHFGLPSTSVYGACCTRNKVMQRNALSLLQENIEYSIVSTLEEAQRSFDEFGGDVYLKSIAGIKSAFVEHVQTPEQLAKVWQQFQAAQLDLNQELYNDFSYLGFDFEYPDPKKHVLIEKAYYGQQIAVAALIRNHKIWIAPSPTDVYTAQDIGRNDSFLAFRMLPSKLSKEMVEKAHQVTKKVIQVLGLKNCGVHAELLVTPNGDIKIIEVASRLGGYRADMYKRVYGIDLPQLLICSVINKPFSFKNKEHQQYVAMHEVFPTEKGSFKNIENLQELEQDPQLLRLDYKKEPGVQVGPASEANGPVITFAVGGQNYQELYEQSKNWQEKLRVRLSE